MPFPSVGYKSTSISKASQEGDPSVNKKITLQIYSYISDKVYNFEAYIYNFGISIQADVSENLPFGRSSRIYTYGGTSRGDIKIDFFELVNSHNEDDVNETYARTSRILKEMYPQYQSANDSITLQKAPLFRVYSPAYITNGGVSANDRGFNALPYGLLGYIRSLDVTFDRSADGAFGHFINGTYAALSPKINYSITLSPIEDIALGFGGDEMEANSWNPDGQQWPMGFDSDLPSLTAEQQFSREHDRFVDELTADLDLSGDASESLQAAADSNDNLANPEGYYVEGGESDWGWLASWEEPSPWE